MRLIDADYLIEAYGLREHEERLAPITREELLEMIEETPTAIQWHHMKVGKRIMGNWRPREYKMTGDLPKDGQRVFFLHSDEMEEGLYIRTDIFKKGEKGYYLRWGEWDEYVNTSTIIAWMEIPPYRRGE